MFVVLPGKGQGKYLGYGRKEELGKQLTMVLCKKIVIRVEWCKAYARAKRWEEEVILVKEEMRRCLVTLEHNAQVWDGRREFQGPLATGKSEWKDNWSFLKLYSGPFRSGTDLHHAEGVEAYARSQAWLYRGLAARFRRLWAGVGQKEKDIIEGKELTKVMRNHKAYEVEDDDDEDVDEPKENNDVFAVVGWDDGDEEVV
ncbi:hypothetical protein VKT23_010117 [Stygiomarasmius scandens]|uniref:Uncharacterized protein n=1 Tax=Marasmiellus scandens TaxID=2682957 RepID=A0ABR1JHC0_9AGAR